MTKYIIVRKNGLETAILLFGMLNHNEAVSPEQLRQSGAQILSAGFFEVRDGRINLADDGSTTLNLDPRPQDADVIKTTLIYMGLANINWKPTRSIKATASDLVHAHN